MATQKEMHELIGRAVVDDEFRKKLIANPESAVKEAGFSLTDEQLKQLKTAGDGKGLASVLNEIIPKNSWGLGGYIR